MKSEIVFTDGIELRWGFFGWGITVLCDLYHFQGILQTQSGEPIEIIYCDQYTPDGISPLRLVLNLCLSLRSRLDGFQNL
jgi:hypothetical protein